MSQVRRLKPATFRLIALGFLVSGGAIFFAACSAELPRADDGVTGGGGAVTTESVPNENGECVGNRILCGGVCANAATSPIHCGVCNNACSSNETCTLGSCVTKESTSSSSSGATSGCNEPLTNCSSECVDLKTDEEHCGKCGNKCAQGQMCSSGACQTSCPSGTVRCGATCVEPNADESFCGATAGCGVNGVGSAGVHCAVGTSCLGGQCLGDCASNATFCNGNCTDIEVDSANCGACGTVCAAGSACTHRVCCAIGMEACMGVCRDTQNDPTACGSCGVTCAVGQSCVNGGCQ